MKNLLFILFFLTGMINASWAQYTPIPLYDPPAPGNKDVEVEEEKTEPGEGAAHLSKVTHPELWHFPASEDSVRPAVIICPGGGYRYQAYDHEGKQVAEWLSSLGYQAFVLKYRLPDEELFTDASYIPLMDARQAIQTVRQQAGKLGVDPNAIGIMGFSAGGHLAASASVLFDEEIPFAPFGPEVRPDFSVLIYPVISMKDKYTHGGSKKELIGENPPPQLETFFSTEKHINTSTPPAFILHAEDDEAVDPENTKLYARALREHQIEVEEIIIPEGGHGFGFREDSEAFEWTQHLARWLEENFSSK
ncbi:MAG: alpha/beta hydrolase [Marinilabilia sp.]